MQTVKYKIDVLDLVDDEFDTYGEHDYDFFDLEIEGQPSADLILCKYSDFDSVVELFFTNLFNYIYYCGEFDTIKDNPVFQMCLKEFFKKTSLSSGKLANTVQNKYSIIKNINELEFNNVVIRIKDIKNHYKNKYISLYDNIRDNLAKDILIENDIHLCPYCQRNYVNVITNKDDEDFVIKPDLDHFYDKAKYIFLAGTLENLIPSCSVCNSRLKGSKDFYKNKHIHPLVNNIIDKVTFNYIGEDNTIFIEEKCLLDTIEKASLNTFRIEEIYNTHKEVLSNIENKYHHYNKAKRTSLSKLLPSLDNREIIRIVFYEYFYMDKNKEPMYKMKQSLFNKIVKI
ncbi:MAG: hypothetical protein DRG78_04060 [Epsilonproteobacteria bacterium]|nr:MAG: hypothetical protein DRG78_04060 [Campylobacterota bacterium]